MSSKKESQTFNKAIHLPLADSMVINFHVFKVSDKMGQICFCVSRSHFWEIMSGFVRAARISSMMFQILGEIVEVSYHSNIIVTQFRKVRIASKSDIHQVYWCGEHHDLPGLLRQQFLSTCNFDASYQISHCSETAPQNNKMSFHYLAVFTQNFLSFFF